MGTAEVHVSSLLVGASLTLEHISSLVKGQETALMLTVQVVGGLYLLGKFCKTLSCDRPTDSCIQDPKPRRL